MAHILKPFDATKNEVSVNMATGQFTGIYYFVSDDETPAKKFEDGDVITTSPVSAIIFETGDVWRPTRIRTRNTVYDIKYW
jgi:hypothetical protein